MGLGGHVGGRGPGVLGRAERAECSRPVPDWTTRHSASRWLGISDAASLISARTGVMPRVPMISALEMSAPSQCEKSMTCWPATPGKKYLLPPEKPDHLVREHRADHQRDVVVDDGAVEHHLDRLVHPPLGQLADPVGADPADRGERRRVPPLVVAHRHAGVGGCRGRARRSRGDGPAARRSSPRACRARSARSAWTPGRPARRARPTAAAAAGSCACRPAPPGRRCGRRGPGRPARRRRIRGSRRRRVRRRRRRSVATDDGAPSSRVSVMPCTLPAGNRSGKGPGQLVATDCRPAAHGRGLLS